MVSPDDFKKTLFEKAEARGADLSALAERNAHALTVLAFDATKAINGDARTKAHLEAQFKLGKFSLEADAFLEARAWWLALRDTLLEIAQVAISAGIKAAAEGLASSMKVD